LNQLFLIKESYNRIPGIARGRKSQLYSGKKQESPGTEKFPGQD
jgi:hypothetical protein